MLQITKISPAWERLTTKTTETTTVKDLELPDDIDQRFFVHNIMDFRAHLVERALSKTTIDGDVDEV